jgi:hypothetical protein
MRDEKGQFIKGHTGNPLGRPKRADEQMLLDIWDQHGRTQFMACVERGEPWALRTLMDKLFANRKPTEEDTKTRPVLFNVAPVFAEKYNIRECSDQELYAIIAGGEAATDH